MTIGGKPQGVKIVSDEELWENGGTYVVLPQKAMRVTGFVDPAQRGVTGGVSMPVYIVNGTPLESRGVEGGQPLPVTEVTTRPVAGKYAVPVYVMNASEWPAGGGEPLFQMVTTVEGVFGPFVLYSGADPIWRAYDQDDVLIDEVIGVNGIFDFTGISGPKTIIVTLPDGQGPLSEVNLEFQPELISLDITTLTALPKLVAGYATLVTLDLSQNVGLEEVILNNTLLSELDLSASTNLTLLDVTNSILTTLVLPPSIESLGISNTDLTSFPTVGLVNLSSLSCISVAISELDLTETPLLTNLVCSSTDISELAVSGSPGLIELNIRFCAFTPSTLDALLIDLDANGQSGGTLDYRDQDGGEVPTVAAYEAYQSLIQNGWSIQGQAPPSLVRITTTSEDSSWNPNITKSGATLTWTAHDDEGDLLDTQVTNSPTFDFSSTPGLKTVRAISSDGWTGATELNGDTEMVNAYLEALTDMVLLNLASQPTITELDLSHNLALEEINLIAAGLTSLDIYMLTALGALNLSISQITSLYVADNLALISLELAGAALAGGEIDSLLNQLDSTGAINGFFSYEDQVGGGVPSLDSAAAYISLQGKGWTLTGPVPA